MKRRVHRALLWESASSGLSHMLASKLYMEMTYANTNSIALQFLIQKRFQIFAQILKGN